MTATRPGATIDSPVFTGDPNAPTPDPGDADTSLATTAFVAASVGAAGEKAILLGKGGGVSVTDANAADFPITVPFDCTIVRMKVTMKTAPSGAMVVQLRSAATPVTTAPTYSDVTGVLCTFVANRVLAIGGPFTTALNEGDMLNFSCATGGGTNIIVEVIVATG